MKTIYGVRLYKNTGLWAVFTLDPHQGHKYLSVRFASEIEALNYVSEILNGVTK